jgi:DNA invertase Pin-like site-specific DNA recombinase
VAKQRVECLRIARERGLTVIREYVDRGRPGHFDRQLELQRLLRDLAAHHDAAYVVMGDYARLGRSLTDFDTAIQHIRAHGAEVATVTGIDAAERFIREHGLGAETAQRHLQLEEGDQ